MKSIQILIILIILIGCQKQFDNKTDPSSIQYSITQFVYVNFEKLVGRGSAGVAELTALKYDPNEFGYTTTQKSIVGDEATVEFDRSITSVSSTPLLPTGITFRQKDLCCQITSFLLTPDSNTKISQPLTKYTITGCRNGNNCITTEIFIQIANASGLPFPGWL